MYSRKSVGPKIKPWGTQWLTEYPLKYFPSRTTWGSEEVRPNIWPEIR